MAPAVIARVSAAIMLLATGALAGHRSPSAHPALSTATAVSAHPAGRCTRRQDGVALDRGAARLAAVRFSSPAVGWVVGRGRILHTTDGGASWQLQRDISPRAGYAEIDAVDADHAWVVGRRQVVATTDGGATWRTDFAGCPQIHGVHFFTRRDGVAIRGGSAVRTSDGGRTWHRRPSPRTPQTICFTGWRRGWIGAHGQVYRTTTGGNRWHLVVRGPRVSGAHTRRGEGYLADVQCAGRRSAWAELVGLGGGANQEPHIAYHLHGRHARAIFAEQYFPHPGVRVHRGAPGSYFSAFSAIGPAAAAFVDSCSPCDYPASGADPGTAPFGIATDHGRRLREHPYVAHIDTATSVAFVSAADGWVLGSRAHYRHHRMSHPHWRIEHTVDGGEHWTTQYSH